MKMGSNIDLDKLDQDYEYYFYHNDLIRFIKLKEFKSSSSKELAEIMERELSFIEKVGNLMKEYQILSLEVNHKSLNSNHKRIKVLA